MRACSQHWTQWPWSQGPYGQGSLCTCPRNHQCNHLHGRKQLLVYSPLQQETGTILLLWIVIFPRGMRERMPLILCWKVDFPRHTTRQFDLWSLLLVCARALWHCTLRHASLEPPTPCCRRKHRPANHIGSCDCVSIKYILAALAALYLTLVSESVTATLELGHKEWLLRLEILQTFDQGDF